MVDFGQRISIALSSDSLPDLVLLENSDMESLIKRECWKISRIRFISRVFVDNYYKEVSGIP